jgi:hypothetical protein
MKPALHDFDVVTDSPAPQRRLPQPAEQAPQPDAQEEERSSGQRFAPPKDGPRAAALEPEAQGKVRAAE